MSVSISHRRRDPPPRPYAEALAHQQEQRHLHQVETLAQLDCLRGVPRERLAQLAELGVMRAFVPGTLILSERAPCDYVYFVLQGTVSLTLHDRDGHEVLIGVLNRGDCFGEGPLFGDLFRGASVAAETICYLIQVPRGKLKSVMDTSPELVAALRGIYRRRLIESTLGHIPLFARLSPFERARLALLLRPRHFPRGATIIREGEAGKALYLVEEGQVVVEQGGQTIAYLDEGDFFGEMALLAQSQHNADVRALTPVEVLTLSAENFNRLLYEQPSLKAQLQEIVHQRLTANDAMHRDHERAGQLAAAIKRGLLRGTHVLVRDPALCEAGCRACEDACTTRHGQPRIHLGGVALNNLDMTDSCRQCRVGAECVEACPESAIQWNDRGALIVTDACTGCGTCVPACPYDAIQLVANRDGHASPLWSLWNRVRQLKQPAIPLQQAQPTHHAAKCDLCHGYDDMACVSACPTGALRLMPIEELFSF
jgi:CRP-like cAMP-binding protein/Fe-S-cluster-containing hydrogenase component 2